MTLLGMDIGRAESADDDVLFLPAAPKGSLSNGDWIEMCSYRSILNVVSGRVQKRAPFTCCDVVAETAGDMTIMTLERCMLHGIL